MQLINAPAKLVLPFANAGAKNTIPTASQIGIVAGAASLTDGFPPLTRTPLVAGGVPPSGLDMNGILYELSAVIRWANAGGGYPYDASFAIDTNIQGYPKGARVLRSDSVGYWFNTMDNNTTDPESAGAAAAGWVPDFTNGVAPVTMTGSNVTLTPLQYGKPIVVISGLLTANLNLIFPNIAGEWTVINNTTGPYSITCKTATGIGVIVNSVQVLVGDGTNIYSNDANVTSVTDLKFGAVADGFDTGSAFTGTDNTAAFQAALDYCGLHKKKLRIPAGKYRFAALTSANVGALLLNYSDYVLVGDGASITELLIDDDVATARSLMDFIRTPNLDTSISRTLRGTLEITGVAFRGRWSHSPSGSGGTHILNVQNFSSINLHDMSAFDVRGKFSRGAYFNSIHVANSRFERIGSDCLRFGDSNHTVISGNVLKWIDDDCIALPAPADVTAAERTSITVTGNTFEQCESILILGAKHTIVSDNTLKFSKSSAIYVGGRVSAEGATQAESLIVANNSVIDPIMRYSDGALSVQNDGSAAIAVSGIGLSGITTGGTYPGMPIAAGTSFIDPRAADSGGAYLMYNYNKTIKSIPAGYNFVVDGNSVMRTLPPVAAFSAYGQGLIFSADSGWVDPAVLITNFQKHGIEINSDCRNVNIGNNTIMGFPNGAGVYLQKISDSPDNELAFDNISIHDNSIMDVKYGVSHNLTSSASTVPFSWSVSVKNNFIDCDPFHVSAARTSPLDGSWQTGIGVIDRPVGVMHRQVNGWVIDGNIIANAYEGIQGLLGHAHAIIRKNILMCDPAAVNFSTSNKGIGDIGTGGDSYVHQVTMCDPRPQTPRTVTLTRSALVVTATSTAHGMSVGTSIVIAGADQAGYNGQWIIDSVTANTFTFIITNTAITPATGTITATPVSYGKHIFSPAAEAAAVPTVGKYVTGHFVKNSNPATASSKTTLGWIRQSVGATHAVATTTTADWAPVVATTS